MFGNRSFNVKLVRDSDGVKRDLDENVSAALAYSTIVKDFVTHTALTVGGVYVVCRVVDRLCR